MDAKVEKKKGAALLGLLTASKESVINFRIRFSCSPISALLLLFCQLFWQEAR